MHGEGGCWAAHAKGNMKKNTVFEVAPIRYADLEAEFPPMPAELPFLPRTDPAVLDRAVEAGLAALEAMTKAKEKEAELRS